MSVIGSTALQFSEEQGMILDTAREFCRDKSPISSVRAQLDSDSGFDQSVWNEMVALGWTGISLPEAYGGSGLGIAAVVPVVECMGRAILGTPLISSALAGQLLMRSGDSAQLDRWLPAIAQGTVATFAQLENADWGDTQLRCTLDENLELSGSKKFVPDAGVADLIIVSVTHNNAPALVVVRKDQLADGTISANTLIDETKRAASVDFTGIQVDVGDVISGSKVPLALRDVALLGALLVAAEAAGTTGACLDTVVEYLKTRKQFGNLIGSYQALKHPMVEILTAKDSARSFIYHGATLVTDETLDRDAELACRMAKAQATETLKFAGDRAVQFHGGMGFTYECDAQLYIRRAQWSQQQFGDAQHHRKRIAALLFD